MWLARPRKSDLFFTNFLPNFPPISIPFLKEKSAPKGRHIVYIYHVNMRTPPGFFVPHEYRGMMGRDGNKLQNDNLKKYVNYRPTGNAACIR